jgi:hypothetical protein
LITKGDIFTRNIVTKFDNKLELIIYTLNETYQVEAAIDALDELIELLSHND